MARPGKAPPPPTPSPTPTSRPSVLWSAVKLVAGALLYVLAGLLLFLVVEHALSLGAAIAAVVLTGVLAPLALAQVLTPAFRRLDEAVTFWGVLPGVAGLCALVTLVALPLSAPRPVARALEALSTRHPTVPAPALSVALALGHALDPSTADAGAPDAGPRDAGVHPRDASADAATVDASASDAVASDVIASDASDAADVSDVSDASDASDASVADDASDDAGERDAGATVVADDAATEDVVPRDPGLLAEVAGICDNVRSVAVGDLEGDARDELIVRCTTTLHVLAFTEGTLTERLRVVPVAPRDLVVELGPSPAYDMDGDGRRDVIVCEHFTTDRGGGRGGVTRYVTNRGDGRFGAFVEVDRLDGCGAVATGDVTGDGRDELLIAHSGNPYLSTLPQGDLAWFARAGRQWTRRGRFAVGRWPVRVSVSDVSGDGILDAVVEHDWEASPPLVLPGSRAGLRAVDATLHPAEPGDTRRVAGRFDLDETPDHVEITREGGVRVTRSQTVEGPTITALSGTPMILPPPVDAGAATDAGSEAPTAP